MRQKLRMLVARMNKCDQGVRDVDRSQGGRGGTEASVPGSKTGSNWCWDTQGAGASVHSCLHAPSLWSKKAHSSFQESRTFPRQQSAATRVRCSVLVRPQLECEPDPPSLQKNDNSWRVGARSAIRTAQRPELRCTQCFRAGRSVLHTPSLGHSAQQISILSDIYEPHPNPSPPAFDDCLPLSRQTSEMRLCQIRWCFPDSPLHPFFHHHPVRPDLFRHPGHRCGGRPAGAADPEDTTAL